MAFNYNKLRGRIIEKFWKQSTFAQKFGISENTLSLKMNNKVRFTTDDITLMAKLLVISESEIGEYFFVL